MPNKKAATEGSYQRFKTALSSVDNTDLSLEIWDNCVHNTGYSL